MCIRDRRGAENNLLASGNPGGKGQHQYRRKQRSRSSGDIQSQMCIRDSPIALHTERGREEIIVENPTYVQQPLIPVSYTHLDVYKRQAADNTK